MTEVLRRFFITCALFLALAPAQSAQADLSLELGNLRTTTAEVGLFAADINKWNLVADALIGFVAPMTVRPAQTLGPSGFELALHTSTYWLAPEAEGAISVTGGDASRLTVSGLEVSKGLPFGLQVSAALFRPHTSSMWSPSLTLQLAILESFRKNIFRYLPDIAVRAGFRALSGHKAMRVFALSIDLILSKPFPIQDVILTPLLTAGLVWGSASTREVDLTPERDALSECEPSYEPYAPDNVSLVRCRGSAQDFQNIANFPRRNLFLPRLSIGFEASWRTLFFASAIQIVPSAETRVSLAFQGGTRF